MNNDNTFAQWQSVTGNVKCDISNMLNRKRTPGDDCALLSTSCIIVNNDLHGTAKETTLTRELSNTPCSGDNLIKKRFLQMFQQKEKCDLLGQRKFQYNRYQKVHHQSTNIHTACCTNLHTQFYPSSSGIRSCSSRTCARHAWCRPHPWPANR